MEIKLSEQIRSCRKERGWTQEQMCIRDSPKKDRDLIFDRFYRVDKARSREAGGAGLGLSIVRDTVVANGGSISVDARPEGGTVFIVQLPLAQAKPEGEEEA